MISMLIEDSLISIREIRDTNKILLAVEFQDYLNRRLTDSLSAIEKGCVRTSSRITRGHETRRGMLRTPCRRGIERTR